MTTNAAANQSIEPVVAQPVVLSVRNLQTQFKVRRSAPLMAVDDVSFDVARGRILGIVGESGSGKSVTGFSIIGLVDPPGEVVGGSVHLDGIDLVLLGKEELRKLRGNRIEPGAHNRDADARDARGTQHTFTSSSNAALCGRAVRSGHSCGTEPS